MPTAKLLLLRSTVQVSIALILFGATGCKKEVQEAPAQTTVIYYGDTTGLPPNAPVDVDGNIYPTVLIGSQRWMTTNLRTAHYRNGDAIAYVPDNTAWSAMGTGAWCTYANDAGYDQITGKLYNWYTVMDSRNVCPTGWHVPTDNEWKDLESALGMPMSELDNSGPRGVASKVGGQMKTHVLWESPNTDATDSAGFSALPGGNRSNDGHSFGFGSKGFWWSASTYDTTFVWIRELMSNNAGIYRLNTNMAAGNSIRCVED